MAIVDAALMTAEEYGSMPDDGIFTELVRGRIIELTRPTFMHGLICCEIASLISSFAKTRNLGRTITNDSGIVTHRSPDSVRGADVAFYSYARLPKEITPTKYPAVAPDLAFEVRSPTERWPEIHEKVAEYLAAGVRVVCVFDPDPMTAHLSYDDQPPKTLGPDDELAFPEILPGFRVAVRRFFE